MSARETPANWIVAPIVELLEPLAEGQLLDHGWSPQCHKEPARSEDEWGVLKTTSIQPGGFHDEHNKRLPDKLSPRPNLEVHAGDLLLTCAGPRARCGVPCLVRETRPRLILSGKMYRFRARRGLVEPRYLEAYLLANPAQAAIDRMKTGISDSGLNLTHGRFKQLPVVVAPLPEQHRIVSAIESYFTRLDDAVATLERVQRNLKRYRASVLKAAVEGRLVPTEAELARAEGRNFEPASVLLTRILAERRRRWEQAELAKMIARGKTPKDDKWKAKYVEPVAPDTSELPELPEGWCWVTLEALLRQPLRNGHSAKRDAAGDVRTLTLSAVTEHDFSPKNTKLTGADRDAVRDLWLKRGDILIERSNTPELVGTAALYLGLSDFAIFPDLLIRVRASEEIPAPFIECVLRSDRVRTYFRRSAQGIAGTMPKISQETILRLTVPVPPAREQARIVAEIDRLLSLADGIEAATAVSHARTQRLRQSILKWAFDGRLVDQDPTDEPASVLLERIRAERDAAGGHTSARRRSKASKRQGRDSKAPGALGPHP
jgi:type I restriction enzyme S subunit